MRRILGMAWVVVVACSCGPAPSTETCTGRKSTDLVITEFLNDPDGTDTGSEWVEVFNTLGTSLDLKGISIYVKKLDGSGVHTHVIRAGTVPARGYFVLGDVRSGALPSYINYAYDTDLGSLSNQEGIIGLKCGTTTFDEVQYTVTPKAGRARQLDGRQTPDAVVNDDETKWCDSPTVLAGTMSYGTPGQANADCPLNVPMGNCIDLGQTASRPVVPPSPGQLFITEVMADPKAVGDTEGEWIELRSNADVDLNGVVLSVGTSNRTLSSTQCLKVSAGSYAVLAHETDAGVNGGLPNVIATFTQALANGGGTLTLSVDDAGIDVANYGSAINGAAWQLDPTKLDSTSNDSATNFCAATVRYGAPDAGDFGTPGAANSMCQGSVDPGQCLDPVSGLTRAVVRPSSGGVFVTEVMADPKAVGDTQGEWLELRATTAADLNGLVLTVGSTARTLSSARCLHLDTGGYGVLAHETDAGANGGLSNVLTTFTQTLGNSGGAITLGFDDGGVIDTSAYPAGVSGFATQLDPAKLDTVNNDDPMSYCRATVKYDPVADAGDYGTPGSANTACPTPVNGSQCIDAVSGLARDVVRPALGDLVITEFMADPSGTDTNREFVEVLSNAAVDLNGLVLANEGTGTATVSGQTCLSVMPGSYSVFAQSADPLVNGGLPAPAGLFSFALANSSARSVSVRNPDGGVLDTFSYASVTTGASTQLSQGLNRPTDNEDAGSVCATPTARYGALADGGPGDRGTPGLVNELCP